MWLINAFGVALIAAIIWWFWLYRPENFSISSDGVVEISVEDGVYKPARVEVPVNRKTILRFNRKDPSPCAATVVFNDFDLSAELPVNQSKDIVVNPTKTGLFDFTCQMKMYKGELLVVSQPSSKDRDLF